MTDKDDLNLIMESRRQKGKDMALNIGFIYDRPPEVPTTYGDVSLEYENQATIDWIREVLASAGDVTDIQWSAKAVGALAQHPPDVLFNITEARGSRNRESLVPAIAESLGIPCTGSDALSLGISLDKYLTKMVADHIGVSTPKAVLVKPGMGRKEISALTCDLRYPLIVKPNTGGSSMGITIDSKVENEAGLVQVTLDALATFGEAMLVEEFIAGREITSGILAREEAAWLPVAEIVPNDGTDREYWPGMFYSVEWKRLHRKKIICPADLPGNIEERINTDAVAVFEALGCSDFARIDYRIDAGGNPYFIEINPLPGLSPYYSIYPMQAQAAGISPEALIRLLLENALKRNG